MKKNWLPPPKKYKTKRGVRIKADGDRTLIPLDRQENDRSIRGSLRSICCDCGLGHLYEFTVFQDGFGQFWLDERAYRIYKYDKKGKMKSA